MERLQLVFVVRRADHRRSARHAHDGATFPPHPARKGDEAIAGHLAGKSAGITTVRPPTAAVEWVRARRAATAVIFVARAVAHKPTPVVVVDAQPRGLAVRAVVAVPAVGAPPARAGERLELRVLWRHRRVVGRELVEVLEDLRAQRGANALDLLAKLVERLSAMGLGDSISQWLDGDSSQSFFEFQLAPSKESAAAFSGADASSAGGTSYSGGASAGSGNDGASDGGGWWKTAFSKIKAALAIDDAIIEGDSTKLSAANGATMSRARLEACWSSSSRWPRRAV